MTTQVASGWDLLDSFDGATPTTISYAAPKTAYQNGDTRIVVIIFAGFSVTADSVVTDPVVTYGNVTGSARVTKTDWAGNPGQAVYLLTCYIPLDTYDGVSDVLSINLTNAAASQLDTFVNSPNRGAFGLVLSNVEATLNTDPFSTIQVHPDNAVSTDDAATLTFTTNAGDYLLGQGFNDTTGGPIDSLLPVGATESVQQIAATGAGSHSEGAMKASYFVCAAGTTDLSFGKNASFPAGTGNRVMFGGMIIRANSALVPSTRPKWVQFGRAIRLPHVLGGNGKFQHEKEALQAFMIEAVTNKVFAKFIPGASHGNSNIRVDVNHPSVSNKPIDFTTFTDTVQ